MTPRLTSSPTSEAVLPDSFSPSNQLVVSTRREVYSVNVVGTTTCQEHMLHSYQRARQAHLHCKSMLQRIPPFAKVDMSWLGRNLTIEWWKLLAVCLGKQQAVKPLSMLHACALSGTRLCM
jgi:hypothetical protein